MSKRTYEKADGPGLYLYGTKALVLKPLEEGEGAPEARPHLRWHSLRGEWVICAAHRGKRTFLLPRDTARCAPVVRSLPHQDSLSRPLDRCVRTGASRWPRAERTE